MRLTAIQITTLSAALLGALACTTAGAQQRNLRPVTDAMLQKPDAADWLSWRRTLDHWGYSPLDQVDKRNVAQLRLVWTRPLAQGVQEGTPLVHDGVMFFPNPNDITQAIDAATGDLIWEYRRPVQEDNNDYIPFPSINRNLAIYGNLILDNGADNYAYALDALTGQLKWETQILDYRRGAQHSSGPMIANGKVISGRSCEPEGGPEACVLTAFDALTGKELWRTHTIPRPDEPGGDTWGDIPYEQRRHVGLWMVPSFDPELNRIYVGTSVTAPAPKFMLDGNDKQYLFHNSTLAIDADTGKIVWYLQHVVDHWDLDHPFERILVDTAVTPDPAAVAWINPRVRPGSTHKVLTGVPGKTGLFYTVDRETGQFLWARPTVEQNVITSVNTESGAGVVNQEKLFSGPDQERLICPSLTGGKNYHAGAYSPQTKLIYMPLQNICMSASSTMARPTADGAELYAIRTRDQIAPGEENVGTIEAISVETGRTAWKREQRAGQTSLMTTASGLLFGGDAAGRFRAYDAETGAVLWEVNLGSHVSGFPATFAVNGKQYVAISTGATPNTFSLATLTPEARAGTANNLYVFALP
jgi:PQQ-dependent dehydrogenase (methanol/ethanol family)